MVSALARRRSFDDSENYTHTSPKIPSPSHKLKHASINIPTFPMPPRTISQRATKRPRVSVFKEIDVDKFYGDESGESNIYDHSRFQSQGQSLDASIANSNTVVSAQDDRSSSMKRRAPSNTTNLMTVESAAPPRAISSMSRMFAVAFVLAVLLPLMQSSPLARTSRRDTVGVSEGLIGRSSISEREAVDGELLKRQDSSTDYCTRWSHQSAVVNGTLYVYGGHASQSHGQNDSTWNNDFLALPLTATWQISAPTLTGLPQPSGPPAVANAYLWNSYDSLFLYGGEFSDSPVESPTPFSMWEYDIISSKWTEHNNPQTSNGTNSDGGNQPVQRSAEGAGISVAELGRGWYFGGHQDFLTTPGWSIEVGKIYLKSLLEFTFPGYSNSGVQSLSGGQTAGADGVWRNVTTGGIQTSDGFTERADGVLVYVPGYGKEGILLGLAGGITSSFTVLNVIDVYDIASSTWYKQTTNGTTPPIRVNPCAVVASAADGSSTNVYLYGGQNLIPYKEQIQYDDMWILTIPAFTWIQANTGGQSIPPARAGHTCNMWDGQIVVVGGYVSPNITCDSPGIYVFDASELKWVNQFTALSGGNKQNQQSSQAQNASGLSGSYGYQVPAAVQSIIGGHALGGATVTAPAVSATDGPLATGKPIIYTVTASNGATVTETSSSSTGNGGTNPNGSQNKGRSGPNIGAIVAGVIAGLLAILAIYLGFCIWVYRRQLTLYKNHVAMSQRAAAGGPSEKTGFLFPTSSIEGSSIEGRGKYSTDRSSLPARSATGTGKNSGSGSGGDSVPPMPGGIGIHAPVGGNSTANSSTEDLIHGQEPSFVGVLLNPRRSLRVINRD